MKVNGKMGETIEGLVLMGKENGSGGSLPNVFSKSSKTVGEKGWGKDEPIGTIVIEKKTSKHKP